MSNVLSKLRLPHPARMYYYGQHSWENYLVDIQETVAGIAPGSNTNNADFDSLSAAFGDIASSIEDLGAEFQWGFTLMIDRLEQQTKLLNQIVGQLDAIREAVQLPSTTRARELFALGLRDLRKGLYPEALEKFLAVERENKVNFPLQLQMGKLLLYGKNATDNVIDLPKAEEHLYLASRYAGREQKWLKYHGVALFHASIAAYLIGEKEKSAGRTDSMRKCLERALTNIGFAAQTWPEAELYYLAAKCHTLLGQKEKALADLTILAERDPIGYSAKMDRDGDFNAIRGDAENILHPAAERARAAYVVQLRAEKIAQAAGLREVKRIFALAERSEPRSTEDVALISSAKSRLDEAEKLLLDFNTNLEGFFATLEPIRRDLEGILKDIDQKCSFCGKRDQACHKCAICGRSFCSSHGAYHIYLQEKGWYTSRSVRHIWSRCQNHPRKPKLFHRSSKEGWIGQWYDWERADFIT